MVLGQSGDLIAMIFLIVGGLISLAALTVGTLRKGRRYLRRHWHLVGGYYALLAALVLGMFWWSQNIPWPHEQPVPLICTFGGVAIFGGPILGRVLVTRMSALQRWPAGQCQKCAATT